MPTHRRTFLKQSLAATAACGLARFATADEPASNPSITDTHVYIGHWPHQTLPSETPEKLAAQLHESGITQAWTGNFDGLFHKDIASANERLANTCAKAGNGLFIPFGTVNPTLPDWEEDIRRCHETFHMPGIRLHPNYHGYTLDDCRFRKLLELAAARGLIVQLVTWMEAERHLLLNPSKPEVELRPLADQIKPLPRLKLLITKPSKNEPIRPLLKNEHVYFDFARETNDDEIKKLISPSPDRVVFGSGAPLHTAEDALAKFNRLNLSRDLSRKVTNANAAALLATRQKTSARLLGNPHDAIVSTQ